MENTASTPATTMVHPCGHCGKDATQQCSHCKNMRYCSLECQQADWRVHKALCKQWRQLESRPDVHARLAIMLDPSNEEPQFVWIPCEAGTKDLNDHALDDDADEDELSAENIEARKVAAMYGVPVVDATDTTHLPEANTFCARARAMGRSCRLVTGGFCRGERLACSLHAATDHHRVSPEDATPNTCAIRLLGEDDGAKWPGMLIIYAMTKVYHSSTMVDIDARSFTLALDAMTAYARHGAPPENKKSKGILVSASEPFIAKIAVPLAHPVFTKGTPSKIMDLTGSRVSYYKQPSLTHAPPSPSPAVAGNPVNPAAWLEVVVDPSSPDFGTIPAAIARDPTTTLVVFARVDGPRQSPGITLAAFESTLQLIQHTMLPLLRDASKTPQERCQTVRAECARLFAVCRATWVITPSGETTCVHHAMAHGGSVADALQDLMAMHLAIPLPSIAGAAGDDGNTAEGASASADGQAARESTAKKEVVVGEPGNGDTDTASQ